MYLKQRVKRKQDPDYDDWLVVDGSVAADV